MISRRMQFATLGLLVGLLFLAGPLLAPEKAAAAGGTNGNLNLGIDEVTYGQRVKIKCYNLDVDSDYSIEIKDVIKANWTTAAAETEKSVSYTFSTSDSTNDMIKIELVDGGSTVIDTLYIQGSEPDDWLSLGLYMIIFAVILVFAFARRILKGMK